MVIRGSEIHPQTLHTRTLETGAKELGVSLDAAQLDQFRRYYLELVEWNSKMNLTTVTDWEEVQKRHFLDSLALAREEDMRGHFDMAFARAVAPMPTLAELTLPFCRVGGLAALHKTAAASAEIESAGEAICIMGGRIRETIEIEAAWEGETSNKTIILIEKTRDTPAKYPRRPGIPAKRPLTG